MWESNVQRVQSCERKRKCHLYAGETPMGAHTGLLLNHTNMQTYFAWAHMGGICHVTFDVHCLICIVQIDYKYGHYHSRTDVAVTHLHESTKKAAKLATARLHETHSHEKLDIWNASWQSVFFGVWVWTSNGNKHGIPALSHKAAQWDTYGKTDLSHSEKYTYLL